jgi:PleD family two-component response regulator
VTTSCGVAELDRDDMKSADQLISAADHALYEAKNGGRNKTIIGSVGEKTKK